MNFRSIFISELASRAERQVDRAVLIVAFAKRFEERPSLIVSSVCRYFEEAHLARPNSTALAQKLSGDRRVSIRVGNVKALHSAYLSLKDAFPELFVAPVTKYKEVDELVLSSVPFIDEKYLHDLRDMTELYRALHVLENSIRRLIDAVLERRFGEDWWLEAANSSMKRKHDDRLQKEQAKKWLPARAVMGPLYSMDWSDLITIIRKYEEEFLPFIGDVDFIHRFADLGLVRHVVAHHGFIDDNSEFQRITLALRDWNSQVSTAVRGEFGATQ